MIRKILPFLLLLCLLPVIALAESTPTDAALPMAEDITQAVTITGAEHRSRLRDGSYVHVSSAYQMTITAPEGQTIGGVSIRWKRFPLAVAVQQRDEDGRWVTVADYEGQHYQQFYPVDGLQEIRILHRDQPGEAMEMLELTVITPGEIPEDVHVWQDPSDKVDLMLLHGHPDDELLWFGGLLPYYGGELHKEVLVVCASPAHYQRRHELLDALWVCGIRTHPVFLGLEDVITADRDKVLDRWGRDRAQREVTELYRRYRPDVVVTHDINGEYGHGVHRAISYAARKALTLAADESSYPQQVEAYGTWDVPKAYVHLYAENQIQMDWWQPLSRFGGRTAQDIARGAFLCHRSQQDHGWAVQDHAEHDNSLFGLYRTTVGADVIGGDLFEHLE